MATTTNYGWTTPDDTALVKDGAAAIRTLGSSVDTTTKNLNPETTLGDIAYRSSTANVKTRLGIGSTGQVLTVAAGVPSWATPAGGGKVLQVVSATYSTVASTSSTSYQDSGLTASITPSSATSKILVLTSNMFLCDRPSAGQVLGKINLVRDATQIFEQNEIGSGTADSYMSSNVAFSYLDSPSTTSSITYKQQFARVMNAGTVYVQYNSSNASIILMEIGA